MELDESKLELTPDQVRSGVLDYRPINADVNFRIQVGPFSESLRIIRNQRQIAAVTTPVTAGDGCSDSSPIAARTFAARQTRTQIEAIETYGRAACRTGSETPVRDLPVQRSREVERPRLLSLPSARPDWTGRRFRIGFPNSRR